jgi:hypothetical protein
MVLQKHIDPCRSSCVLPLSEKGKNDLFSADQKNKIYNPRYVVERV